MDRNLVDFRWALAIQNSLGFLIFPIQHTILARAAVQRRMEAVLDPRFIRPVFVGTSGTALWVVLWLWQPLGPVLYRLPFPGLFTGVFFFTVVLLVYCTVKLNHAQMFGLKQGYAAWKDTPVDVEGLKTAGAYGIVRHPITSLLVIALWAQESMTAGRLLWNLLFTCYALIGTIFEEKTLMRTFGEEYRSYAERVPAFIPRLRRRTPTPP